MRIKWSTASLQQTWYFIRNAINRKYDINSIYMVDCDQTKVKVNDLQPHSKKIDILIIWNINIQFCYYITFCGPIVSFLVTPDKYKYTITGTCIIYIERAVALVHTLLHLHRPLFLIYILGCFYEIKYSFEREYVSCLKITETKNQFRGVLCVKKKY